uniref:Uncharacterized protein n=1 Tax=Picea glauca TaxID=3330 RepID=A0A101M2G4_PICGL|nr:hypothetical protein ABT39_MTgene3023 [Picea glauca]QHR91929.1 hypothetical protein Q903MT_gene5965 [Picea sitchensis]
MISTNRIDMCSTNHTPRNYVPRMDIQLRPSSSLFRLFRFNCFFAFSFQFRKPSDGYREPVDAMTYQTRAVAAAM